MIEERLIKTPRKHRFFLFLTEFASFILGIIGGGIITLFLLSLDPKIPLFSSQLFQEPPKNVAIVDIAKLYEERIQFLESMARKQSLIQQRPFQDDLDMHLIIFFEHLHKAIDKISQEEKVTLIDSRSVSELPDYTDKVKKQLYSLENQENPFKESKAQQ
ncbi:MAG: hypothetical protein BGO67_03925 [Alphaproteobacteria bacterium 41-28]|nr:MAG: hypothetical protein BGO67_03925 [Alphaproteobacteria bacterium 41-28]